MTDCAPTATIAMPIDPAGFALDLLAADSFAQVIQVAESRLAESLPEARLALWWTQKAAPDSVRVLHCAPRSARAWTDPEQALQAMAGVTLVQGPSDSSSGILCSRPLELRDGGKAVLQMAVDAGSVERLESDVALRQALDLVELRISNLLEARHLKGVVRRLERSEAVQRALFRIAELTGATSSMEEFYAAVHAQVGELLYARNFYIALLDEDGSAFDFPYAVDERDDIGEILQRQPLRHGLTEYVQRTGKPLLLDQSVRERLIAAGEIRRVGSPSVAWLGVPLVMDGRVAGVLAVQSYSEDILYEPRDQDLLAFVAQNIATALHRRQVAESLRSAYAQVQAQLEQLRQTQSELIENEKMASLGRLVAGVAHEINTPLGIAVTSASHLDDIFRTIERDAHAAEHPEWSRAVGKGRRCVDLILNNIGKAAQLVRSFKQVAVDQSDEIRRLVTLHAFLEDVLLSLHPRLKASPHRVEVDCAEDLALETLPGALYQVVSNIILNAQLHAFVDGQRGLILVVCRPLDDGNGIELTIRDDGIGMPSEIRQHVFEPFFTTRRGRGGTGLGLHMVYNLVTQLLGGTIACVSAPGEGTRFTIRVPVQLPPGQTCNADTPPSSPLAGATPVSTPVRENQN